MRALVFTGPGQVELRDEPAPDRAAARSWSRSGPAASAAASCTASARWGCACRRWSWATSSPGRPPSGRRVVVNPLLSCGHCAACRRGRAAGLPVPAAAGRPPAGRLRPSVAAVPDSALHDLPDAHPGVPPRLIEPLANAVHAWDHVPDDVEPRPSSAPARSGCCAPRSAARGGSTSWSPSPSAHRREVAERLGLKVAASSGG